MACGSCGGGTPIRVERTGVHTSPRKVIRVKQQKLGTRKLAAKVPVTSVKPANSLDKHRA